MHSDAGIVSVACGKKHNGRLTHAGELANCVESIRKFHPRLPITVWSDAASGFPAGVDVRPLRDIVPPDWLRKYNDAKDTPWSGKWGIAIAFKLLACLKSPYKRGLWLDTDIWVLGRLDELFEGDYDLAMSYDFGGGQGVIKTMYNSGVMPFRLNPRTKRFLRASWDVWTKSKKTSEQRVMYRLLDGRFRDRLKFKILDHEVFNVRPDLANSMPLDRRHKTLILHSRGHKPVDTEKRWVLYKKKRR